MLSSRQILRPALASVLTLCFSAAPLLAQQPTGPRILRIKDLDGQRVATPEYEVKRGLSRGSQVKQWFRLVCEYDTAPKWVDELDFTYYVLLKGDDSKNPWSLLRGRVSYVNIEKGSHESNMYLAPSTIARMGDVERVAVLIYSKGQLVGIESEPSSKDRWWEQAQPRDGFVLNRLETPFAMLNFDDFEAIKASSAAR